MRNRCSVRSSVGLLLLALFALLARPAGAGTITAFDQDRVVTGVNLGVSDDRIYGWLFETNVSILVTQLGYFDESLNGLLSSHDVGIWDVGGSLLTSAKVPSGAGGTLDGTFRYVATAPVLLVAHQKYVIGATIRGTGDDPILSYPSATNLQFDPGVTFLFGRAEVNATGLGLVFPSNFVNPANTHLDANFKGESQTSVPEPSSLVIFLICGSGFWCRMRPDNTR